MDKIYYQLKKNVKKVESGNGHYSYPMLGKEQGCKSGCCAGISYYTKNEYTPAAVHNDQEGFMVLSGEGWARIGTAEIRLEKEMAFIVPAGVEHQMRCENEELVLFWFHASS